jgi:hypothetical protein
MCEHQTNVHKLGAPLGVDPVELLRMINGKAVPTKAVIDGLAKLWTATRGTSKNWLRRSGGIWGGK